MTYEEGTYKIRQEITKAKTNQTTTGTGIINKYKFQPDLDHFVQKSQKFIIFFP